VEVKIMKKMLALLIVVVSCTACLKGQNRHAFYLEPDGAVTWAVTEEDVRSDAGDREQRRTEELEYLAGAQRGETEIGEALREVGAQWIQTTVVRQESPYTVLTQARFESAERMLESFLRAIGFEAETALQFDGERATLSFRFWESPLNEGQIASGDGPADCLVEPLEQYRFVLTEGRFEAATGFRLDADRTVAVMLDLEESDEETDSESAFYSLTWSVER
jgi:hypothetical protein